MRWNPFKSHVAVEVHPQESIRECIQTDKERKSVQPTEPKDTEMPPRPTTSHFTFQHSESRPQTKSAEDPGARDDVTRDDEGILIVRYGVTGAPL